jgi:hypothetical protein
VRPATATTRNGSPPPEESDGVGDDEHPASRALAAAMRPPVTSMERRILTELSFE